MSFKIRSRECVQDRIIIDDDFETQEEAQTFIEQLQLNTHIYEIFKQ